MYIAPKLSELSTSKMNTTQAPIKEIKVSEFYPEQWDDFQETFTRYYGTILDMYPIENRNTDGTIKVPYSIRLYVKEWQDSEAVYNFIKRLENHKHAKMASDKEIFWDVTPVKTIVTSFDDPFPAPRLDPSITNADLAARCWAPMKFKYA